MTDEEIEKALEIHFRREGVPSCWTCPYYNEFCHGDCLKAFGEDMQNYINRLKTENSILKKNADEAFQQGLNEKRELLAPEIRKETAKEIFEELRANEEVNPEDCDCWLVAVEGEKFIKIAKKYGVEIEK